MSEEVKDIAASPVSTETLAIPEAPKEYKQTDPAQALSNVFGMYKTPFINLVEKLSNKSARRVLKSLILLPLEDYVPNLKRPEEKAVYQIGEKLLLAKMSLIMEVLLKEEQERVNLLENSKKETSEVAPATEEIKKESNG